ncbi:MAG: hypothetical protein WD114_01660 [Phycisphaerales bacterium]
MGKGHDMGQIGELLTAMTGRTMGLADALSKGITPETAARQPRLDGKAIACNHPSFVYGHLAIYPEKIMRVIGAEPGDAAVPANYGAVFEAGNECVDDPEGTIYPPFEEVLAHFNRASKTVIERVGVTDDKVFSCPIEGNERAAEFFGTAGVMASFMLHDHTMFHLGQLSTWRRAMGLGSAM